MSKYIKLSDFNGLELKKSFKNDVFKTIVNGAERCEKAIVSKSPVGNNHRMHKYSETWKVYSNKDTLSATVYNKENYRLTHLLENGHFIITNRRKLIWVAPRPHIEPGFDETKDQFVSDMEKVDIDVDFK